MNNANVEPARLAISREITLPAKSGLDTSFLVNADRQRTDITPAGTHRVRTTPRVSELTTSDALTIESVFANLASLTSREATTLVGSHIRCARFVSVKNRSDRCSPLKDVPWTFARRTRVSSS